MVIIDDRPDLHVLIGKRRPGAFVGDRIVFPGGAVDAVDFEVGPQRVLGASAPGLSAADAAGYLHAAVCESREEVGLWPQAEAVIDGARFVAVGHWVTPQGTPRRYDTRFFLARYPGGEAAVCDPELVDVGGGAQATRSIGLRWGDCVRLHPRSRSLPLCRTIEMWKKPSQEHNSAMNAPMTGESPRFETSAANGSRRKQDTERFGSVSICLRLDLTALRLSTRVDIGFGDLRKQGRASPARRRECLRSPSRETRVRSAETGGRAQAPVCHRC